MGTGLPPPASLYKSTIFRTFLCLRARFRPAAHLPVEGRGLKETVDISARIAELRSVLLETRSDDVRKAIQAAIADCRRKLAEVEERPGAR